MHRQNYKKTDQITNGNSIERFLVKSKHESKESSIKSFTEQKLAKQVNLSEQNSIAEGKNDPSNEIDTLKAELLKEKKKNEQLESDLKKSVAYIKDFNAINLSKDIEIEKLTKKLETASLNTHQSLFSEFDNFDEDELKVLRSIKSGISQDSTFVLKCMRFLYPNPAVLNDVSVTGKQYRKQRKEKLCEKNVNIITAMLRQRINSEDVDQMTTLKRLGRMNKLIRDAITKIRPKIDKGSSKEKPIDEEKIQAAIDLEVNEPTSHNGQPFQPQVNYASMWPAYMHWNPWSPNYPQGMVSPYPSFAWPSQTQHNHLPEFQ